MTRKQSRRMSHCIVLNPSRSWPYSFWEAREGENSLVQSLKRVRRALKERPVREGSDMTGKDTASGEPFCGMRPDSWRGVSRAVDQWRVSRDLSGLKGAVRITRKLHALSLKGSMIWANLGERGSWECHILLGRCEAWFLGLGERV